MAAIELGLLVLVALVIGGVYLSMKVVKPLIVNAVVGLVAIVVVEYLGFVTVEVDAVALGVVALGGLPGAALVALLAWLDVAFAPGLLLPILA